jgi:hypothetical protein
MRSMDMLYKALNLLAIPAGLEPATIGLEGPKPTAQFCGLWLNGLQAWTINPLINSLFL